MGISMKIIGSIATDKIKLKVEPITTVLAISLKAGIFPKLTPATPTAVVKLVRNTGVKFIFILSTIDFFLSIPSFIFVNAIDKI